MFSDSDKSKRMESDQRRSGFASSGVTGWGPGTGWFIRKTALRWGLPYREFIVELFSGQHPWGSAGNGIWKRE